MAPVMSIFKGVQSRLLQRTARRCFASGESLSSPAQYHDRILRCAKAGDAERATSWFQKMRAAGFEPDLQAYNILLSAHASRGDINAADEVLDSMQEDRCKPDQYTYSSAIQSCEPTGDILHAQAHFQKMQQLGIRPTDVVCNALIAVQASVGDVEGVQKTLKEMKSLGVAPDRVSFNSAIATGVKAGDPDASTRWFYEMKQSGFQPDATTYTSVVNSSVSKRDMEEAEKWIVRATEENLSSPAPFNCLIDGYGKVGDLEAAEAVLERMRHASVQPNMTSYNALINAFAEAGQMKMALSSMSRMRSQNLRPDAITYTSLIGGFAAHGHIQLAQEWLDNMLQSSLEPNSFTFGAFLRGCEKLRDVEAAHAVLRKMQDVDVAPNRVIFNTMLNMYASAREMKQAEAAFQELVHKETPDLFSFAALVKAASRLPDLNRSKLWMKRSKDANLAVDARMFNSLFAAIAQLGDLHEFDAAVHEMKAEGMEEDVVTCSTFIRACATAKDLKKAEETLERMESKGLMPNIFTMNAMMTCCATTSPQKAEYWFAKLVKKGVPVEIIGFNSLLSNWTADPARMQQWIRRMNLASVTPDTLTYNGLLNSSARVCDEKLAQDIWKQMEQASLRPTLASYRAFSKALARQGLYQEVSELVSRMSRENRSPDIYVVRAVLTACAQAKSPEAAKVAEETFKSNARMFEKDDYALRALRLALTNQMRGGKSIFSRLTSKMHLGHSDDSKKPSSWTAPADNEEIFLTQRYAVSNFVLTSRETIPGVGVAKSQVEAPQESGQSFVISSTTEPLLRTFGHRERGQNPSSRLRLKVQR